MQITFATILIGQDFSDGGFLPITGFKPKAKVTSQKAGWMRAPYETLFTRGNRLITLQGIVIATPAPSLAQAMLLLETLYGTLPDQGDLVKTVQGASVTYPNALLESWEAVEDLNGVSYGYKLTFLAGKPSSFDPATDAPVTDPSGTSITDPSGVPITDTI